ncbi:hypothetical protein KIMCHI1738_97 [Corynebacterium phage Kimchi1738]|uniref:Uncharacterized protein n=1 Tax=Corynebacterium phage Kimchi1738 TaxID=2483719 RepID=A0A3G3LWY0_9CAUD|nr:hypothetical protein KNU16_gp47 [Corynebacterium phage Kimchi1738]AYQ98484.1 hypothetical protein KIMCHI1738_97 [Corynebacterium phage Kimchi1738]
MINEGMRAVIAIATRYGIQSLSVIDGTGCRWEINEDEVFLIETTGEKYAVDVDEILGAYQGEND